MAVVLRLTRGGTKKKPFYRIVAADSRMPRDGRYIEIVGFYKPQQTENQFTLNEEKIRAWLKKGAKPSDTVKSMLKKSGIIKSSSADIS